MAFGQIKWKLLHDMRMPRYIGGVCKSDKTCGAKTSYNLLVSKQMSTEAVSHMLLFRVDIGHWTVLHMIIAPSTWMLLLKDLFEIALAYL